MKQCSIQRINHISRGKLRDHDMAGDKSRIGVSVERDRLLEDSGSSLSRIQAIKFICIKQSQRRGIVTVSDGCCTGEFSASKERCHFFGISVRGIKNLGSILCQKDAVVQGNASFTDHM